MLLREWIPLDYKCMQRNFWKCSQALFPRYSPEDLSGSLGSLFPVVLEYWNPALLSLSSHLFLFLLFTMENHIFLGKGGKYYDLTESKNPSESWYGWVESSKLYMRRMVLSKGELFWLCRRLKEATKLRGKSFKSLEGRGFLTYICCAFKYN